MSFLQVCAQTAPRPASPASIGSCGTVLRRGLPRSLPGQPDMPASTLLPTHPSPAVPRRPAPTGLRTLLRSWLRWLLPTLPRLPPSSMAPPMVSPPYTPRLTAHLPDLSRERTPLAAPRSSLTGGLRPVLMMTGPSSAVAALLSPQSSWSIWRRSLRRATTQTSRPGRSSHQRRISQRPESR